MREADSERAAWVTSLADELAQACGDPGSIVGRKVSESLSRWSGRAVQHVIAAHLGGREAKVRAEAKVEALREAEFEVRDARTLDPATQAAVCAVLRTWADRIEAGEQP